MRRLGDAPPGDGWGDGAAPLGAGGGGGGKEGAGCCHLGGGEGGCWPHDAGPSRGARGSLIGGWVEPAAHGWGGPATSAGGNLVAATTLTTSPCLPVPVHACGWPLGGHGDCGGLATRGLFQSRAASHRGAPIGGAGWWQEAPGSRWARAGGGVVKAGWPVSRRDPTDRASMWPYLPPRFVLPRHLYTEDMEIRHRARDTERKSRDHLRMGGYWVLKMLPLRDLPMPWRLGDSEEKKFWKGKNMAMGGDLGLGCPPPGVRLEEARRWIPWMPE